MAGQRRFYPHRRDILPVRIARPSNGIAGSRPLPEKGRIPAQGDPIRSFGKENSMPRAEEQKKADRIRAGRPDKAAQQGAHCLFCGVIGRPGPAEKDRLPRFGCQNGKHRGPDGEGTEDPVKRGPAPGQECRSLPQRTGLSPTGRKAGALPQARVPFIGKKTGKQGHPAVPASGRQRQPPQAKTCTGICVSRDPAAYRAKRCGACLGQEGPRDAELFRKGRTITVPQFQTEWMGLRGMARQSERQPCREKGRESARQRPCIRGPPVRGILSAGCASGRKSGARWGWGGREKPCPDERKSRRCVKKMSRLPGGTERGDEPDSASAAKRLCPPAGRAQFQLVFAIPI